MRISMVDHATRPKPRRSLAKEMKHKLRSSTQIRRLKMKDGESIKAANEYLRS